MRHHPRLRHHRIRGDERAQGGVVESGVVEHQPGGVLLLAGVGAVRGQGACAAGSFFAVGVVRAIRSLNAAGVGGDRVAAQVVRVQVGERSASVHGDGHAVEGVVFDGRGGAADLLFHVEREEVAGGLAARHFFDAVAVGVVSG